MRYFSSGQHQTDLFEAYSPYNFSLSPLQYSGGSSRKYKTRFILTVASYLALLGLSFLFIDRIGDTTYLDEAYVVAMLPLALMGARLFYRRNPFLLNLFIFYFFMLAISSSVAFISDKKDEIPLLAYFVGILLDGKMFVLLFSMTALFYRLGGNTEKVISSLCKAIFFICSIHAVFALRDIASSGSSLTSLPLVSNPLWGFVPIGLLSHKSSLAILFGLANASVLSLYVNEKKSIWLLCFMIFFTMLVFTSSMKELVAVIVMFVIMIPAYRPKMRNRLMSARNGLVIISLIIGLVIAIYFLADYISYLLEARSVYFTEETVRSGMYRASIRLALDYFPIGSGAGTFGSYPSRTMYFSSLYDIYGLSSMYGGSAENSSYLMDTWWPKVLGEAGLLGGGAYLMAFLLAFYSLTKSFFRKVSLVNAFGVFLGVLVLSTSTASALFNGDLGSYIAAIFLLMYSLDRRRMPNDRSSDFIASQHRIKPSHSTHLRFAPRT